MDPFSGGYGQQSQIQQMAAFQQQRQQEMLQMQRQYQVGPPVGPGGQTPPKGSLIIADVFTPSEPQDKHSHGEVVKMAARQNGFKGPVFTQTAAPTPHTYRVEDQAEMTLTDPTSNREDVLRAIGNKSAAMGTGFLQGQTELVNQATNSGAENTALNISMGMSKASVVEDLYGQAALAWNPQAKGEVKAGAETIAGNYSKAYGLDLGKLQDSDPKVSGPERGKLQQNLIKHVDHSFEKNPNVTQAKGQWSEAVKNFESKNNSVVVSAGNEGQGANFLIDDAHGHQAFVPADYQNNLLENSDVTSVGATRWHDGPDGPTESVAKYSSRTTEVDIFASGSVDTDKDGKPDQFGTSFSGPRAAATMAGLHKKNPGMSSSQVENLMRNSLTHDLNTKKGDSVQVLDFQKSADFLAAQ